MLPSRRVALAALTVLLVTNVVLDAELRPSSRFDVPFEVRHPFAHDVPGGLSSATLARDHRATKPKKHVLFWMMHRQEQSLPTGSLRPLWRVEAIAMPVRFFGHFDDRYVVYVSNGFINQTWLYEGHRTDEPQQIYLGYPNDLLGNTAYEIWFPNPRHIAELRGTYFVKLRDEILWRGELVSH